MKTIILTGMHRSGTSLFGRFFQASGVYMGEKLMPPNSANPHGYYEDLEVVEFHRSILKRQFSGEDPYLVSKRPEVSVADAVKAQAIIVRKQSGNNWGWKDPRTALFLDFWHGIIPEALFVFVFRNPLDVVDSILRRDLKKRKFSNLLYPDRALRAWIFYNQRILNFYTSHKSISIIFSTEDFINNSNKYIEVLSRKTKHPFSIQAFREAYDKELLHLTKQKSNYRTNPILRFQANRIYQLLNQASQNSLKNDL